MRVYAVVSEMIGATVEVFPSREEAEVFLSEVRHDEPEMADQLAVEVIEVGEENPN